MKKIFFFLSITSIGFFSACTSDALTDIAGPIAEGSTTSSSSDDDVELLPAAILAYLEANYPGVEVLYAEDENNNDNPDIAFEVNLADGTELYFDADGGFLFSETSNDEDDTSIDPTTLSASITNYLAVNYPDATIEEVNMEDSGVYEVELGNGLNLYFDATGNFIGLDSDEDNDGDGTDDEDDGDDDDGDDDGGDIDITTLPTAITDYVAANYPGTSITEAHSEDNGGFEIELDNGTELYFDADGNFIGLGDDGNGGGDGGGDDGGNGGGDDDGNGGGDDDGNGGGDDDGNGGGDDDGNGG